MRTGKSLLTDAALKLGLACFLVWSFGPIFMILLYSFKMDKDIFTYVPRIISEPVLDNYLALIQDWPEYFKSLQVSVLVTLASVVSSVLLSLPAAYAYSRLPSRRLAGTALFLVGVRMLPPIIITIPLYPILRTLGIIDTPLSLVLVYTAFQVSLSVMLLKTFIDGISIEIEEQALIDGCSRLGSFVRVVLPLMAPGIIAVSISVAIFVWNDFVFAFLLTGTRAKTAPIMIAEMRGMVGQGAINWGTVFAGASIQLAPIMFFIWLVQKRLIGGYTLGAVKG
jgi:multiple sugar transport system permease protein